MSSHQHDATLAHPAPAVKVAGRRMSATKPRPHPPAPQGSQREHVSSTSASSASVDDAEQPHDEHAKDDYPRPAAPTPGHVEHHEHHGFETYGKRPEHVALPHGSKPSSEAVASPMTPAEHGSHGRIAQPQGKQLNV